MKPVIVSAHNPMTGPRHLGHYLSTMNDWPRLQRDHELFIVVDDIIASILYPRIRKQIQTRSFQVAREFLAMGLNMDENHLILTSMIPEAHELATFMSTSIDLNWSTGLYKETFAGLLSSYQRRELQLPRTPSLGEMVYPRLNLAALTLGLQADLFHGGEEMRGYLDTMDAIAEGLGKGAGLKAPPFLPGRMTFVLGTDGKHMGTDNAIYVSDTPENIQLSCSKITSAAVLDQWYSGLGKSGRELTSGITAADGCGTLTSAAVLLRSTATEADQKELAELLSAEFAKFRTFSISDVHLVAILEQSSIAARERVKDTLIQVKAELGIPGFTRAA